MCLSYIYYSVLHANPINDIYNIIDVIGVMVILDGNNFFLIVGYAAPSC